MLGKWLRAAGHDAYYAREGTGIPDQFLAWKALDEGQVLLSSDRGFLIKPVRERHLLVAPARRELRPGTAARIGDRLKRVFRVEERR